MYDHVFHQAQVYDMRLHRDDRSHYKGRGLDISEEVWTQFSDWFISEATRLNLKNKSGTMGSKTLTNLFINVC